MKKYMNLVFIVILLTILSACSRNYNFDYETLVEEVSEIKIVHIIQEWGTLEYDIVTEIDEQNIEAFLLELSKLELKIPVYGDRGDLNGETCIMLIYENGYFDLIAWNLTVKFDESNGKITWDPHVFDKVDEFNDLVGKYQ